MTALAALEPEASDEDPFCDALLGLDRACRELALLVDEAACIEPARAPSQALVAAPDEPRAPDEPLAPDEHDELLDAVLGLVSLRTTLGLVLAALREPTDPADPPEIAVAPAPDWSRELLR